MFQKNVLRKSPRRHALLPDTQFFRSTGQEAAHVPSIRRRRAPTMTRHVLATLTLFFTLLALTACRNDTSSADTDSPRELRYAATKDIRDINPHLYTGEMAAQAMVFEPLVSNTPEGIRPCLAESWDISDDGRIYTFHLRRDVRFSDGEAFNAAAVKQNMDAILANRQRHAWMDLIRKIERDEIVDEFTYRLYLRTPYYPTLIELGALRPFRFTSPRCLINGQSRDGVRGYAGTGPWLLAEHKERQYALFTVNPLYRGEKPRIPAVRWLVMPDHQSIALALQKGDIHLVFGSDGDMLQQETFEALRRAGKHATLLSPPIASRALLLNSRQPFTEERGVRQALQYAVNRSAIVEGILDATESPALTLMAPTVPYCDVPLESRDYDPARAAALLDAAGWPVGPDGLRHKDGRAARIRLYYNADNAQERSISEYIQADFKKIGVDLRIIGEETQAFRDRQRSGDFELQYARSWGAPYDPQSYLSSWRIPAHGDYQAQAGLDCKPWLDQTVTAIMAETDETRRRAMYREILSRIHEEAVYLPLSYSRTRAVHVKHLHGVTFDISQYVIPFEKMFFASGD